MGFTYCDDNEGLGVEIMKKVAVFQSDLHVGGIQKALINFLTVVPLSDVEVDVYLFDQDIFYDLSGVPKNVHFYFSSPFPFLNRFVPFALLNQLCKNPIVTQEREYDVAIDFSSYRNECALGALKTPAKKRIMWIHNDIALKKREEIKYRILFHFFKGKFRYFDKFVAVSDGIIDSFVAETGTAPERICGIPNAVDAREILAKSAVDIDFRVDESKYNLVSMGRLCHQKGFDILLMEFAEALKKRSDLHLYIIGDGPDRGKLWEQCIRMELEKHVSFLGNQANPFPYLAQMDGFALDSRYEGQGIVLWEAKVLGLELFFPRRLEKYNAGLVGVDDVAVAIAHATKQQHRKTDDLQEYNMGILLRLRELMFPDEQL